MHKAVAAQFPDLDETSDVPTWGTCFMENHQYLAINGTVHKPVLVVFYDHANTTGMESVSTVFVVIADVTPADIPDDTLGQLADYASAIWASQPTRKFVHVFLVCGMYLCVVIFFRDTWACIQLGPICYKGTSDLVDTQRAVHSTLKLFWFLLTLPTEDFGHYCNVTGAVTKLQLYSTVIDNIESSAFKDVCANPSGTTNDLEITKPIHQTFSLSGRTVYLYRVKINGRPAVFKLAWARATETPEGTSYDLLSRCNVPGVTKVYDSGIIIPEFRGFRLEYLITEDCGQQIVDYIDNNQGGDASQIARNLVAQVCECLVSAYSNGILHRDISPENITVCSGVARVINWGNATILDLKSEVSRDIAQKWHFDTSTTIMENSSLVGTDLYMSISVLFRLEVHRLLDDIESLFYVILDAFSTRRTLSDGQIPICFRFYDLETLGAVRATKLDLDSWLESFGVETNSHNLRQLFNAMHTFLFKQGNRYIGLELMHNNDLQRAINIEVAREFMNDNTIEMLHNVPRFAAEQYHTNSSP